MKPDEQEAYRLAYQTKNADLPDAPPLRAGAEVVAPSDDTLAELGMQPEDPVVDFDDDPVVDFPEQAEMSPGPWRESPDDIEQVVRGGLERGLLNGPGHVDLIEFAREARLPQDIAQKHEKELRATFAASQFDAKRWVKENPELADIVRANRKHADIVVRDEQLSWLAKRVRADAELGEAFELLKTPGNEKEAAGLLDKRFETRKQAGVEDPSASQGPLEKFSAANRLAKLGTQHRQLGAELLKADLGIPGSRHRDDIRREMADLELELGPRFFNADALEQLGIDTINTFESVSESFAGAGRAAVAAGLTGAALGVVSRGRLGSPLQLAKQLAKMAAPLGAGAAGFAQEAGGLYPELLDEGIPAPLAQGVTVAYGLAAGVLEAVPFATERALFDPMLAASKRGELVRYIRSLGADKRSVLVDLGRRWAKAAGAEGITEGLQEVASDVSKWAARNLHEHGTAAKAWEPLDWTQTAVNATEAAVRATTGMLLGGLAPSAGNAALTLYGAQRLNREAAQRNAELADVIVATPTETAIADPQATADLIFRQTGKTHIAVDPAAVEKFFQSSPADPEQTMVELLGEDGPRMIREAKATGQKLDVPLVTYFQKWQRHDINKALAGNVSMTQTETAEELARLDKEEQAQVDELVAAEERGETEAEGDVEGMALDRLHEQLVASGRYDDKQAQHIVDLHKSTMRTLSKRVGTPVEMLYQQNELAVGADGQVQLARRDPDLAVLDAAIEAEPPLPTSEDGGGAVAPAAPVDPAQGEQAVAETTAAETARAEEGIQGPPIRRVVEVADFSKAQALIARMTSPERRAEATRWLNWVQKGGSATGVQAPTIERELSKRLHELGFGDPTGEFVPDWALYTPSLQAFQNITDAKRKKKQARMGGKGHRPRRGREVFEQAPVETPTFKKWFGKSKVVDEDGKPRRVYHGTNSSGFDSFKVELQDPNGLYGPGFYFTEDPGVASEYTDKGPRLGEERKDAPAVYPVFLSIQNPLDTERPAREFVAQLRKFKAPAPPPLAKRMIDSALREESENFTIEGLGAWADNTEWAYNALDGQNGEEFLAPHFDYVLEKARDYMVREIQSKRWGKGDDIIGFIKRNVFDRLDASKGDSNVQEVLKKFGFDGIAHIGGDRMGNGHHHQVWIAFESGQVKSAVGNDGTFDKDDPSILSQGDPAEVGGTDDARGRVEILRDAASRLYRVVLGKKADLSTFLHESGHIYLDMLEQLAAQSTTSQKVRDDLAAARKWMGVEDGQAIGREHHEKWARGFEAYLREGKAPSSALASAFQAFKLWLTRVYQSLAQLNVELDDDIRGVFDRLIATDEEIADVRARMGFDRRIFATHVEAGVSPEEFAELLKLQEKGHATVERMATLRVLRDQARESERWWKAESKKLEQQALAEFAMRPDVRALEFIRTGTLRNEDGTVVKLGEPQKLDRKAVEALLGPERAAELKRLTKVAEGVQVDGADAALAKMLDDVLGESGDALHPDEVAERFGFEDGRALLEAILVIPDGEAWARERASEQMQERHPDILRELGELRVLIAEGFHGEHTADMLVREIRMLRAKVATHPRTGEKSKVIPREEVIKRAARQIVERRGIRRLDANAHMRAQNKAAEQAVIAAAKGNFAQALVFKLQQLLNFHIYRELSAAVKERDKFEELLGELGDRKARERLGRAGPEFRDFVDTLLDAVGAKEAEAQFDPADIDAVLPALEEPAFDVQVVREVMARPRHWKDLTVAQMREVDRAFKQVRHVAREALEVKVANERMQLEQLVGTVAAEVAAREPAKAPLPRSDSQLSGRSKFIERFESLVAEMRDPEELVRRLGDTAFRVIWRGYLDARNAENALAEKVLKKVEAMVDEADGLENRFDPIDASELPMPAGSLRTGAADRMWAIMVALNMGNESNRQRLLDGYGWSEGQVLGFLGKTLTKKEWAFVQRVFDLMDGELWPEVARVSEAATGLKPPKILPTPIITPHGIIRGGYFPAKYDNRESAIGLAQSETEGANARKGASLRASVSKTFTKSRAKKVTDVVNLQWGSVPAHVAQVVHFVAFDEYVRNVEKLRLRPEFNAAVQAHLGPGQATQLGRWTKAVADTMLDSTPPELRQTMALLGELKGRFVFASLGYSLTVAAGDASNLAMAVASKDVKTRFLAPALLGTVTSYGERRAEVLKLSAELRNRDASFTRKLRDDLGDVGKKRGTSLLDRAREHAFIFSKWVDNFTSTAIWEGMYRQHLAEDPDTARAARLADDKIRGLLPSVSSIEQPAMLRDKRGVGSILAFMGYYSRIENRIARDFHDARTPEARREFIGKFLAMTFVLGPLSSMMMFQGPEDDEGYGEWLLRKWLATPLQLIPGGSLVADKAAGVGAAVLTGNDVTYKRANPRSAPTLAAAERFGELLYKAATTDDGERAFWSLIEAGAIVGKVPGVSQARRMLRGGDALIEGETSNPAAVIGGP